MGEIEKYITDYKKLNLDKVTDYAKFNAYSITAHTTQIEGSTLTLEETHVLLNDGITPKGRPLNHVLMVSDHHIALEFALEAAGKKQAITTDFICRLNAMVLASTGTIYNTAFGEVNSAKGEFRKGQVFVANRYFPNFQKVPILLEEFCQSLNTKVQSVKTNVEKLRLSFYAHYNLVSIHPHYDGNGRTGRLLMNLIQRQFDLPLSIVYSEDKLEYYKSLEDSRKEESLTPFYEFMEAQYVKLLSAEIEKYNSQLKNGGSDKGLLL